MFIGFFKDVLYFVLLSRAFARKKNDGCPCRNRPRVCLVSVQIEIMMHYRVFQLRGIDDRRMRRRKSGLCSVVSPRLNKMWFLPRKKSRSLAKESGFSSLSFKKIPLPASRKGNDRWEGDIPAP